MGSVYYSTPLSYMLSASVNLQHVSCCCSFSLTASESFEWLKALFLAGVKAEGDDCLRGHWNP